MEKQFRAWDWKNMIILNLYQCEHYEANFVLKEDNEEYYIDDHCTDVKYPIMQYIWKKDVHWNKIFVWDIVQYEQNSRYWEIYFDDNYLQFRMRCKDREWEYFGYSVYGHEIIVKGNIKETPELLNK